MQEVKKLFTLIMVSSLCLCQSIFAQHIQETTSDFQIRYGNCNDETVKVLFLVDMDGYDYKNATYALAMRFGGELLPCSIQFNGQDELEQFYSDLKQIRNKYSEWLNVAKQNGVKDLVKDIPFCTEQVELTIYDGRMNELKTFKTSLKGMFRAEFSSLSLFPNQESIRINFRTVSGNDIPIFHVRNVNDLDKILNAVNIEKIKAKLSQKIQKQNLFN